MLKLGTKVKDKVSGVKGMLINMQVDLGGSRFYNFQPRGLHPKTGLPLKKTWLTEAQIDGGVHIPDDIPTELLGTQAEDIASGYKGTITALTLHINGCLHAIVQQPGIDKEKGELRACEDFDIRQLKGPKIKALTEAEKEKSIKEKPSPVHVEPRRMGR